MREKLGRANTIIQLVYSQAQGYVIAFLFVIPRY
jgi:hypothetical protein